MKNFFLILIALFSIIGCKQEPKTEKSTEDSTQIKESPNLKVVLEVLTKKDDVFEVYYYEPGEKTFSSNKFVFARVNGSMNVQEVTFNLPSDVFPERLRLDFGKNEQQDEMKFLGAKLVYGDKEYKFSQEEMANQFKPSKFLLYDPSNNNIKTMSINGRYDPYFYTMKVNNIVNFLMED
ncbi:hypothetical protein [Flagellimonas oceanensis]|uniref:hypothetical protein n=1 Tax=Flagellimonas oceanensis TaxID=2499163 RepID=UPI000F8F7AB4|nr:hypothetical protein [Allomuricauda oceanensis]